MSHSVQLALVWACVAGAALAVLRATWRTWFGAKPGCGSGCGKCAAEKVEPRVPGRTPLPMA